jgi:hypothetical protein
MTTSSAILHSYLVEVFGANAEVELKHEELLERNLQQKGGDFLTPLNFYLGIMADTDPIMTPYMSDEQKNQLRHDLKIAYLLLCAQKQYELTHQKTENRKRYDASIKQCETLLDRLNPLFKEKTPEESHFADGKPVKYLGIHLAKEFSEKIVGMMDRKTKTIKETIGAFNEKRLYWVWGSTFIKTMLSLSQEDFYNTKQAGEIVRSLDPYTGALSWALYYFRFSLNLFLLLKHTIKGPWMSKEEAETPWELRFQGQWNKRKFGLLNDFLWGPANTAGYFWLRGVLGPWGDTLTIFLLIFDISAALWDFAEQEAQYHAQMEEYEREIEALEQIKKELSEKSFANEEEQKENKLKIYRMELQINALKRAQATCDKNWNLQRWGLYNNIGYAMGLMLSFVALTMPFMPLDKATALTLGVVGAVLCFTFTVLANSIRGGIEIYKSQEAIKDAKRGFDEHVGLLKELIKTNPDLNDNQKKFLYLEIKKYKIETEYQKQMIALQTAHLIRSTMIEALFPAITFVSLVFLPMGIGFAALGAVLGFAILSNLLIDALFKPDPKMKELSFDEKEYREFCALINKEEDPKVQHAFFKPAKEKPKGEEPVLSSEPKHSV